jgi:hypothetical protein
LTCVFFSSSPFVDSFIFSFWLHNTHTQRYNWPRWYIRGGPPYIPCLYVCVLLDPNQWRKSKVDEDSVPYFQSDGGESICVSREILWWIQSSSLDTPKIRKKKKWGKTK